MKKIIPLILLSMLLNGCDQIDDQVKTELGKYSDDYPEIKIGNNQIFSMFDYRPKNADRKLPFQNVLIINDRCRLGVDVVGFGKFSIEMTPRVLVCDQLSRTISKSELSKGYFDLRNNIDVVTFQVYANDFRAEDIHCEPCIKALNENKPDN